MMLTLLFGTRKGDFLKISPTYRKREKTSNHLKSGSCNSFKNTLLILSGHTGNQKKPFPLYFLAKQINLKLGLGGSRGYRKVSDVLPSNSVGLCPFWQRGSCPQAEVLCCQPLSDLAHGLGLKSQEKLQI